MGRIGLAAVTVIALAVTPSATHACIAEQSSFAEAIAGAAAIARVVVEDVTEYREPPAGETYRVVRVLKGQLPDHVQLDDPRTGLCADTIGYFVPEGTEAIVAFGVPFYDTLVNPAWKATGHPVEPVIGFGATTPEGVATLDDVERLILATLPDTALPLIAGGRAALFAGVLLLVAAAVALSRPPWLTGSAADR